MDPIATTALYTAMKRAMESAGPDPLFTDPLAAELAGAQGREVLDWMEARAPGVSQNQAVAVRTRFFDDALQRILAESDVNQLVIVAAGLDSRAFRLQLPADFTVFELDRPELLDLKATRLAQVTATPRCRRIPIPIDLAGDWSAALHEGGFDRHRPAIWLVEGLLFYVTEAQVHQVLGTLSELAVAGSWLLTDIVGTSFLRSPYVADFLAMMAANGSPWRFGTDAPEALVEQHGWQPQVTHFGEMGADFGRWPAPDHDDPDYPHGYLIVAQR
ncbi:MAG: SAM-dependent methyltransferase [Pseudonocardiaceae bacterium]